MRFEGCPVLAQFAQVTQAEDLEAATIGEDGAIPVHEVVQSTKIANQLGAWSQHEMVGVGENDGRASLAQIFRGDAFDACLGADGHEDGCGDDAVGGVDCACPCPRFGTLGVNCE